MASGAFRLPLSDVLGRDGCGNPGLDARRWRTLSYLLPRSPLCGTRPPTLSQWELGGKSVAARCKQSVAVESGPGIGYGEPPSSLAF